MYDYDPRTGRFLIATQGATEDRPEPVAAATAISRGVVHAKPWAPGLAGQMPNCPGRGSPLRYGKSIVAIGGPAPTVVGATASATLAWKIAEAGHVGKLVLQEITAADLDSLTVTSISYDNDQLISGNVPANMFRADSTCNPLFGHYFEVNHDLEVVLFNSSAGALTAAGAWNVLA